MKIFLKRNQISVIDDEAFAINKALHLDLSLNSLRTVRKEVFEKIVDYPASAVQLRGNKQIVCNCDLKWIIEQPKCMERISGIRCNGKYFRELKLADLGNCS